MPSVETGQTGENREKASPEDIGYLDYAILKVVAANTGRWKKWLHDYIITHQDRFPFVEEVAVQTVGRHLDRLQERNLVEPMLVDAENKNRKYLIGFKTTEDGEALLQQKRHDIVKKQVILSAHLFTDPREPPEIEREALEELFCDEFLLDVDEVCRRTNSPLQEVPTRTLVILLAMYYFRQNMRAFTEELDEKHIAPMRKLIADVPALRKEFLDSCAITEAYNAAHEATGRVDYQ